MFIVPTLWLWTLNPCPLLPWSKFDEAYERAKEVAEAKEAAAAAAEAASSHDFPEEIQEMMVMKSYCWWFRHPANNPDV